MDRKKFGKGNRIFVDQKKAADGLVFLFEEFQLKKYFLWQKEATGDKGSVEEDYNILPR
jgi:hypothetical protein